MKTLSRVVWGHLWRASEERERERERESLSNALRPFCTACAAQVKCPPALLRAICDQRGGEHHHLLLDDPLDDLRPAPRRLARRAFALAFHAVRRPDGFSDDVHHHHKSGPLGAAVAASAPLPRSAFAALLPALHPC